LTWTDQWSEPIAIFSRLTERKNQEFPKNTPNRVFHPKKERPILGLDRNLVLTPKVNLAKSKRLKSKGMALFYVNFQITMKSVSLVD